MSSGSDDDRLSLTFAQPDTDAWMNLCEHRTVGFKYALPEDGGGVVDWLQKYEDFAKTDEAPQFIKDDFRQMNFVDDGEEIAVDDETTQDSDFQVFAVNPHFEAVASAIAGSLDAAAWAMRSARRYTQRPRSRTRARGRRMPPWARGRPSLPTSTFGNSTRHRRLCTRP